MKVKGLILSMALLLGVSSAWADDNVSVVRPLNIKAGQTQKVAVVLENANPYTAFQMDIKLPTGLTLNNLMSPRTSAETFHNISFGEVEGGYTRVVALSYKQETDGSVLEGNGNKNFIDGKSEIILYFDITAANDYVDNGDIEVKNVKFVSADGNTKTLADASGANGSSWGDVNKDHSIDALDASLVLQCAAKKITKDSPGFDRLAADVNVDVSIDALDASLILQFAAKKITW
jgi:hypothetical protein